MQTLADIGAVPLAEVAGDFTDAARGVPIRKKDGTTRAFALVEADDYEWAAARSWYLGRDGYVYRNLSHITEGRGHVAMHRELAGLKKGDGLLVDHVNRQRMDNRRSNLRVVTDMAEQLQNVPSRGGFSKHRGVSRYTGQPGVNMKKRWTAQVQQNGKLHRLGYFATEQEAADAAAAFRRQRMPFATD